MRLSLRYCTICHTAGHDNKRHVKRKNKVRRLAQNRRCENKRKTKRRLAGLCPYCGESCAPQKTCELCLFKRREMKRLRKEKNKVRDNALAKLIKQAIIEDRENIIEMLEDIIIPDQYGSGVTVSGAGLKTVITKLRNPL